MESPFDGAFRKYFAQNPPDVHIYDHSLSILGDGSSSTEVKDELRRQELEPELTQEQQEEDQGQEEQWWQEEEQIRKKIKKKGQGREEQQPRGKKNKEDKDYCFGSGSR